MTYNKALLLLPFVLISCASNRHSRIISFTPASVVVDYSDTGDLIEATDQAQRYCSSAGKDAQYVDTKEESSILSFSSKKTAFFNCVARENASSNNGNNNSNSNGGGHTIINNPPAVITHHGRG